MRAKPLNAIERSLVVKTANQLQHRKINGNREPDIGLPVSCFMGNFALQRVVFMV
jgi:hypothetical protein